MIQKQWNKRLLSGVVAACLLVGTSGQAWADNASAYLDIQGHWAQAALKKWAESGKIGGYEDGTLRPNKLATRAEVMKLVNASFGLTEGGPAAFADVDEKQWFYRDLGIAVRNGYMSGFEDGTFRPSREITREQLAVILVRLLKLKPSEGAPDYADTRALPAWSRGAVGAVVAAGLMTPDAKGLFYPKRSATRAEIVVVLDRAEALSEKQNGESGAQQGSTQANNGGASAGGTTSGGQSGGNPSGGNQPGGNQPGGNQPGGGDQSGGGSQDGDGAGNGGAADVFRTADALLAAAKTVQAGGAVALDAAPSPGTVAWLAQASTTQFAEGLQMTKLVGNGTVALMAAPATAGSYKLYVLNAESGATLSVSSASLTVAGTVAADRAGDLFAVGRAVRGGASIALTVPPAEGLTAWFAPSGTSVFAAGSDMTAAVGSIVSAPSAEGDYRLYLVDASGQSVGASVALLRVDNTAPSNSQFASNVAVKGRSALSIGGLPAGASSAWLAPAGTSGWVQSATMSYSTGGTILAPAAEGSYRLYLLDDAGNVSSPSTGAITVDNTPPTEQNDIFAADATRAPGQTLTLPTLPVGVKAWFAPAVASVFAPGAAMTVSTGSTIAVPQLPAVYKLFLVDDAGNVSQPSKATLTITNPTP